MSSAMPSAAPPKGYGPRQRRTPVALKLWVSVVITNVAGMMASLWLGAKLRAVPATSGEETLLFAAYYTAMAIAAIADALLLDELLFKGAFRISHLQGKTAESIRPSDDVATVAASLQRSSYSFPALLIAGGIASYVLFNAVNGGFNFYWRTLGKHISALRDEGPESEPRRLQAIAELSIRRDPHDRHFIPNVLRRQLDAGGTPSVWAAWALGRFSDLPARQRGPIHDSLLEATRAKDPALRREAVIALARLQYRPVAKALAGELDAELAALDAGDPIIDPRLVYATGWVQSMDSVPGLTAVLGRGDERAQRIAAWALAQHRDEKGGREVVRILEERLPAASLPVRCAIVFALGITSDEASNGALMHAHDLATADERNTPCELVELSLRPDEGDEGARLLEPVDTYEMKILHAMGQVRATSPEIRAAVEPWLAGVVASAEPGSLKKTRAESLLEGIKAGRDDTLPKPGTVPRPADAAPAPTEGTAPGQHRLAAPLVGDTERVRRGPRARRRAPRAVGAGLAADRCHPLRDAGPGSRRGPRGGSGGGGRRPVAAQRRADPPRVGGTGRRSPHPPEGVVGRPARRCNGRGTHPDAGCGRPAHQRRDAALRVRAPAAAHVDPAAVGVA